MADSTRDAGIEALRRGDPEAARGKLEQAVMENPQDPQAHAYLGAAYGQLQILDRAVESLSEAARLAPGSAPLRYNLAVAQEKAGKRDEAVASYRQALAIDSTYDRARQALIRMGRNPDATSPYSTAPAPQAPKPAAPTVAAATPAAPAAPADASLSAFSLGGAPPATTPAGAVPLPSIYDAVPQAPPAATGAYASPLTPPPPPPQAPQASYGIGSGYAAPPGGDTTIQDGSANTVTCPRCSKQTAPAMLCGWCSAPLPPPPLRPPSSQTQAPVAAAADPVIHRATSTDGELSRPEFQARSYLAGMTMGTWWGLIGAVFTFLMAMSTQKMSEFSALVPVTLTICAMQVALGALLFGGIGLLGANSEDAESTCSNCATALGVIAAFGGGALSFGLIMWSGAPIIGSIWLTRIMGKALGNNVNELQQNVLVVAGPGTVAVAMRGR